MGDNVPPIMRYIGYRDTKKLAGSTFFRQKSRFLLTVQLNAYNLNNSLQYKSQDMLYSLQDRR